MPWALPQRVAPLQAAPQRPPTRHPRHGPHGSAPAAGLAGGRCAPRRLTVGAAALLVVCIPTLWVLDASVVLTPDAVGPSQQASQAGTTVALASERPVREDAALRPPRLGPSVEVVTATPGRRLRRELTPSGTVGSWSRETLALPSPIVIGGLGGSGTRSVSTTLLHLGCSYPARHVNPEMDCIPEGHLPYTNAWPLAFSQDSSLGEPHAGREHCLALDAKRAYAEPSTALVEHGGPAGLCWFWKDPRSWVALSAMRTWLVGGHTFMLVVRDPRDVALSTNHNQLGAYGPAVLLDVQQRYRAIARMWADVGGPATESGGREGRGRPARRAATSASSHAWPPPVDEAEVPRLLLVADWTDVVARCGSVGALARHVCHDDAAHASAAWLALARVAQLPTGPHPKNMGVSELELRSAARDFVFTRGSSPAQTAPLSVGEALDGAACIEGQVVLWARLHEQVSAAVDDRMAEAEAGTAPPFGFVRLDIERLVAGSLDTFSGGDVNATGVEATLQLVADVLGHRDPSWVHTHHQGIFTVASGGSEDAWKWTFEDLASGSPAAGHGESRPAWGSTQYVAAALARGISVGSAGADQSQYSVAKHYGKWRSCAPGMVRWLEGLASGIMRDLGYAPAEFA